VRIASEHVAAEGRIDIKARPGAISATERGITTKARDNKLQVQEWTIGNGACGHATSQECEDVSPAE